MLDSRTLLFVPSLWDSFQLLTPDSHSTSPLMAIRSLSSMSVSLFHAASAAKSLQSCLTLCDPIDGSPPGSSVPGILQARTLEWVAISFSNA